MSGCLRWFLLTILIASAASLSAEDTSAILARLQAATTENSLDVSGIKPWHLKVSFQTFDDQGKLSNQGTMEEWWSSPTLYKIAYKSTSYTATEIVNGDDHFYSLGDPSTPYMMNLLHELIVHPAPSAKLVEDSKLELYSTNVGKVKLDCIALKPTKAIGPQIPQGLDPTYCLDHGIAKLRVAYLTAYLQAVRNTLGTFQQRTVSIDTFVTDVERTVMTAQISSLTGFAPDATTFAPTADMSKPDTIMTMVGSRIEAGLKLSGPMPTYPRSAREDHIMGSVVLSAVIGADGHIHQLEVEVSPDSALSLSARNAVQQWVYRPYLLNGVPTEVKTTITVNFNFGPA